MIETPAEIIAHHASMDAAEAFTVMDVDTLAQIIRKVDGSHNLGACELAEAIIAEMWQPVPHPRTPDMEQVREAKGEEE